MISSKSKAILMLQDGRSFSGFSFGHSGETSGEVVFNTSMTGYQEILTDPSYRGQIVTMTYPMMGNYGINPEDVESARPQVAGFIVKEYVSSYSNHRARMSLGEYLEQNQIVGLAGIDTRALVRHIREAGAMPGLIAVDDLDLKRLKKRVQALPSMEGQDLVQEVSVEKSYSWPSQAEAAKNRKKVIAYDFGIKSNILRHLDAVGCDVTVVPASTPAHEVLAQKPDGVFLSNGPGDPAAVDYAIRNTQALLGKVPIFGICLGHQILGLARGATTFKLKFGHRGGNQPVKNLQSGRVEVTAQNHGFAIDRASLQGKAEITHVNLNDDTVAGFRDTLNQVLAVQYHPESSPGPHDSLYLFQQFREMMEK